MGQAQSSPVVNGVGKALHERLEYDVHEPLPERWVDLIHYLNEKERSALTTKPPTTSVQRR